LNETLSAVVEAGEPGRIALFSPEDGTPVTARALAEQVERTAAALAGAGIERGDRVALVLPNGPEFVTLLLAVTSLGAAAAPLNPAYTRDEFAFYLDDLAPKALVVPEGEAGAAREAAAPAVGVLDATPWRGTVALSRGGSVLAAASPGETAQPDDVALLLHTSGTTSRPKQVPLLHRNLVASARAIAAHYELGPGDVSFSVMPLFHVHGLVASVLAQLVAGGRVVAPRRLSPRVFWAAVERESVSWFSGSPTLLTMLLDGRPREVPTPALRFVRSCSAALSSDLFDRIESELAVPVLQAYGMTEASHQIASNPLPPERRDARSVGVPTGTEVTTLDEQGRRLPDGTPGEVAIRGPGLTPGYLNNDEANASAFVDGWFRTGDRGVVDADGYVMLEGRIKELIIRGGENISPSEIEDALKRHPAVVDAAAFGLADAKYGEVVGAAVVVSTPTDERELVSYCREKLAPFKVPQVLRVMDELPKTATGKVQRRAIAAAVAGGEAA
jgi:acyl-CoA synthetase (AMP-forming)/AMP-acid ligase II